MGNGNRTGRTQHSTTIAAPPHAIHHQPTATAPITTPSRPTSGRDALNAALEASLAESPLPNGWDEVVTARGVRYFVDHLNKSTSWDDPRLLAAGLANRLRSARKKAKLPRYHDDLYGKVRRFTSRLHELQNDEGQLHFKVSRENIFEDSFEIVFNLDSTTLTRRLMVEFDGEVGLDYGGMSREWFIALTEEFFKPERKLFIKHSKGYHFQINPYSHLNRRHLSEFTFVGMVLGMAIYHGKLFYGHFSVPFYKALLNRPLELEDVRYFDEDVYKSLVQISEAEDVDGWDLNFTTFDTNESGDRIEVELKPGGMTLEVTNENKGEFIELSVKHFENRIADQLAAILRGLHAFVPVDLISEFEPNEIDQLIGGVEPDLEDLKSHVVYTDPLTETSPVIRLFWEVVATFNEEEMRRLVRFVTGTDKVPIGGFQHLVGSTGPQLFTISLKKVSGLPTAHTCFNRLELPNYTDKNQLRKDLLIAISEYSGFGIE